MGWPMKGRGPAPSTASRSPSPGGGGEAPSTTLRAVPLPHKGEEKRPSTMR